MFLQYEINRYKDGLTKDFDAKEIQALLNQAIIELKTRNIAGIIILPATYLIAGLTTEYASEQTFLYSFFGTILLIAIFLRIMAIIAMSKKEQSKNHIWLPVFFWSNIFVGLTWGCFAATAVLIYHDSLSITLFVIFLAGIGSGSMASYNIWRILAYAYLLILLLPAIIAQFYIGNSVTVPIGIAFSIFLIFNLVQVNLWNKSYWLSLINIFLIKKNAVDLEKLNRQLTDEISNHKQTSQKIAVSRKKLQDIYHSAHDGIFIFDLDGQAIDSNETMLKMFRMTRQQALTFNIHRSLESKNNPDVDLQTIWQETLEGKDQEFEWLVPRADQEDVFTVQVNLQKCLWGEDSVIIATVRDITPQFLAMQATIAANHAKSEFLANMSHELRTPMHGILGYARLGIKRSDSVSREKLNEYFDLIQQSGTRLMDLLNKVLDFSKLEVGKMRYNMNRHDLIPQLHQVTTELAPIAAEKGLSFEMNCVNQQAFAYCDHEKITQVFRNILFNAITFSDKNTTIQILCDEINQTTDNPRLRIAVSNWGISIPEDELESIFKEFMQSSATDTGAGGTGLGLAISRRILSDHNSTIWAENDPAGSTIFRFTLPTKEAIQIPA